MAAKKTIQEIVKPIITAHLEKRFQFSLANKHKRYPTELTFKSLAARLGISTDTLTRWYRGTTKTTRKTAALGKAKRESSRLLRSSRSKLKRAAPTVAAQSSLIDAHVERLHFAHKRPSWRVHTTGWPAEKIYQFVWSIIQAKKYDFYFTIWNPQLYAGDPDKKGGGYMSSGWINGRARWKLDTMKSWILREQLSRGEIHAIIFTEPR